MKDVKEQRNCLRYNTGAKVKLAGLDQEDISLKDISVTGCRVECADCTGITVNNQYELEVVPEKAAKIGSFDFLAETKWLRKHDPTSEIGFFIIRSPKGDKFQRYVDYLAWRDSQGFHHNR